MKKKNSDEFIMPDYPPMGMPLNPLGPVVLDPMGSYTGRPIEKWELPVQDADDL